MIKTSTPLLGRAFNDVLNELHQLVFQGVPGESEPFELTPLEREYIAYVEYRRNKRPFASNRLPAKYLWQALLWFNNSHPKRKN